MLAVDEAVGRLIDALRESGELENTYIFFTSDNGWHAGEHRLTPGKWTAYEEDIRVPLIVRGPGVPEGRELEHLALNNDLAPTFADLGGVTPPRFRGRTLAQAPALGRADT
jgi:N-acetylglucosamine-6-sulfatase